MRRRSARVSWRVLVLAALLLLSSAVALGQTAAPAQPPAPGAAVRPAYLLGPDDQISIQVPDAEEITDKPIKLDSNGDIKLPMIGRVHAGGLSAEQLELEIAARLKQFLRRPDVTVSVLESRSQPSSASVSILGSVKTPGLRPLQGAKSLVEVIADAGGIADDAGYSLRIVRRIESGRIPLPAAKDDETGRFSAVEVSLAEATDATQPAANLAILPQDVITIPRGRMIYVVGQVPRPGGFVLQEREKLSVLKAYTLAGGDMRGASPKRARILRLAANGDSRIEVPVDVKSILNAKAADVPLLPEDVLFIPGNSMKKGLLRLGEVLVGSVGYMIYRLP